MNLIAGTPAELTAEWFTRVLRAGGTIDAVSSVVAVRAHQIGTGQLGSVLRVELDHDSGVDAPASLVVKLPSADAGSRRVGVQMGIYRSEVLFYQQIAPRIRMRTPRVHFGALDETGRFTLVLEDLSAADAGDVLNGATAEQASLAVRELVRLQAPLWDDPGLRRMPWLGDLAGIRELFTAVPGALGPFRERFADRLEQRHMALVEALAPRAPEIFDAIWRPPFVLAHCDYRLDNMLFGTTPQAPPLAVIDWQTVCLAPPGLDLAVFLASSVDTETRRGIERRLIEEYADGLAEAGVRGFGPVQAWQSYRTASLSPFLLTVFVAVALQRSERGDAMWTQLLRGAAELVADVDAAGVLDRS